jgi:hypothetical protein
MASHRASSGGITVADILARERPDPITEPLDFTSPTRRRRAPQAVTAMGLVAGTVMTGVFVAPEPRADPMPETMPEFPVIPQDLIDADAVFATEVAALREHRADVIAEAEFEKRRKEWQKNKAKQRAEAEAAEAARVAAERAAAEQAAAEKAQAEQGAAEEAQAAEAVAAEPRSATRAVRSGAAQISNSAGPVSARAQAAADAVVANVPGAALITMGGTRGSAQDPNGHPSGNAIDYMVGGDTALGDAIFAYHMQNWEALGVQYIIWKQTYYDSPSSGGSFMEDRGSGTANHYDHPHVNYHP